MVGHDGSGWERSRIGWSWLGRSSRLGSGIGSLIAKSTKGVKRAGIVTDRTRAHWNVGKISRLVLKVIIVEGELEQFIVRNMGAITVEDMVRLAGFPVVPFSS